MTSRAVKQPSIFVAIGAVIVLGIATVIGAFLCLCTGGPLFRKKERSAP